MGFKNILITLDGSDVAEQAMTVISGLANPGSNIHVLSIVSHDTIDALNAVAFANSFGAIVDETVLTLQHDTETRQLYEREDYLKRVTQSLVDQGYSVTLDVRLGEIVKTIIETARNGYDVIVMATHGRTGLQKALIGSVAENVLHKAPCPVVLIPVRSMQKV